MDEIYRFEDTEYEGIPCCRDIRLKIMAGGRFHNEFSK